MNTNKSGNFSVKLSETTKIRNKSNKVDSLPVVSRFGVERIFEFYRSRSLFKMQLEFCFDLLELTIGILFLWPE